ncbi:hypothetical protein BH11PSE14_BH11PSE14_07970 [soil metagenome]
MNSRYLMSATAVLLALLGLACSFAPQELLGLINAPALPALALVIQALGAAWLGFAMLDWQARGAPFGGIYGRPVALGNFLHFVMLAAAIGKVALSAPASGLLAAAAVSALFALAFGALVFGPAPRAG